MHTRSIGQSRRKHGAHGARPTTVRRSQPKGVERSALVAPHSDTAGVPSAAARCSAPESGPKASRARARMASSWRSVVRPTRSRTPPSVARSVSSAKGASAAAPSRTALAPCRARSSRSTAAVRSGNQRRLGHEEPTHAATSGPSRPAVMAAASRASSAVGASPNSIGAGGRPSASAKARNCASFGRPVPWGGSRRVARSQLPSRPSARAKPMRSPAPEAQAMSALLIPRPRSRATW